MIRPIAMTLVPRLMADFGYSRAGAELVAGKLIVMDEAVWSGFWSWWQTGQLPALALAGYNLERLMNEHGMKPVAAILTLDWLAREPAAALASLRKGHDSVS